MLRHHQRAANQALLAACLQDSVLFSKHFLQADLCPYQVAIHRAIDRYPRVAVKAATSVGKTFGISAYAASWLARYPDGIVMVTSSRWAQVKDQFFREVRGHIARARGRYRFPEPNLTELSMGPNRFMIGLSPDSEEGMGGYHSGHVLEIIDEGSDVPDHVYDGAEGPMSGGHARLVVLGNPLSVGGRFHRIFTQERADWHCISVSAWDTPNFAWLNAPPGQRARTREEKRALLLATPDDVIRSHITHPNLTSPLWVKGRAKVWEPTHPAWQARIEAEFPTLGDHALLPLTWAERARERPAVDDGTTPIEVGLDIAGGGRNATAGCARAAPNILGVETWHERDPLGPVLTWLRGYGRRLAVVRVDITGVGLNFLPRLAAANIPCEPFQGGATARDSENFVNRNAEAHWGLRTRFESDEINGFTNENAFNQLTAMEYGHDPRGRTHTKGKGGLTAKGIESPDEADAVTMAFAGVVSSSSMWEAGGKRRARRRAADDDDDDGGGGLQSKLF